MQFLRANEPQVYALFRMVTGFLFLWHGMQKLFGFPGEVPAGAPAFILYTAGPIELVGGLLVMIGLQTRLAAFICSGTMAFAYWMAHAPQSPFPLLNRGDAAILYCFVFLYLAFAGGGPWSLDALRRRNS